MMKKVTNLVKIKIKKYKFVIFYFKKARHLFAFEKGLPDFFHPSLQTVEFLQGDFGGSFLETELVCGSTIDQIGMFEHMGGDFVHGAGFDQGLDQADIVRPFQKAGILVGI